MLIRSCEAFVHVGGSILHTCHNWEDMQTLDTVLVIFRIKTHGCRARGMWIVDKEVNDYTAKAKSHLCIHIHAGGSKPC